MNARRILHVIPAIAARYGGPSSVCLATCRALAAAGVDVTLVTTDADGDRRLGVPLERASDHEGVRSLFFRRRWSESFKWSPDLARWLDAHVGEFDVVDIHAVFSHSSIAAGAACHRQHVPFVVRPHGALDPWSLRRKAWRKRVVMAWGAGALLRNAAAVQYTTAEEQRLAETEVDALARAAVVPLGVGDEYFEDGPGPDVARPYILVLSRLHEKKNIDVLIGAFHDAAGAESLTDWRLVIAGDGDPAYVAGLRHLAAAGRAADRVEFRGWVDGREKQALLRGAAAFAVPSHQENFGISLVEAMACGVPPVVGPGVNLSAEIERAGAGWVVSPDRARLATALITIAGAPAERRDRGHRARAFADPFRWSTVVKPLIELYDTVQGKVVQPAMGMTA